MEKRPRELGKVLRGGEDFGTVWEYQLKRVVRRKLAGARVRSGARELSQWSVVC